MPYFWCLSDFLCSICHILPDCQDSQCVFVSLWSYGWAPPVRLEAKLKTAGTHPKVPIFVHYNVMLSEEWRLLARVLIYVSHSLGNKLVLCYIYRTESWGQKSWMVCQPTAPITFIAVPDKNVSENITLKKKIIFHRSWIISQRHLENIWVHLFPHHEKWLKIIFIHEH